MDKKINEIDREYVLRHYILEKLRFAALTIVQTGSDAEGHTPLDLVLVKSSTIHYGTLVAILNDNKIEKGLLYSNIILKREQVFITKYDWPEINVALQILADNGHIIDEADEGFYEASKRTIQLTVSGLKAFNTRLYLKEGETERLTNELHESQLSTNHNVKMASWASFFVGLAAVVVAFLQYSKKDSDIYQPQLDSIVKAIKELKQMKQEPEKEQVLTHPFSQDSSSMK